MAAAVATRKSDGAGAVMIYGRPAVTPLERAAVTIYEDGQIVYYGSPARANGHDRNRRKAKAWGECPEDRWINGWWAELLEWRWYQRSHVFGNRETRLLAWFESRGPVRLLLLLAREADDRMAAEPEDDEVDIDELSRSFYLMQARLTRKLTTT